MSLGALGDSFYEYLLKSWIQSGQTDNEAREMYDDAMAAIMEHMIRTSNTGLIYTSDLKFDRLEYKMDHLACFSGISHYINHIQFCNLLNIKSKVASLRWAVIRCRISTPNNI